MSAAYSERARALSAQLGDRGWDAFLARSPVAMGYLHGFFEGSHERFLALAVHRDGRVAMIAPALSGEQARRHGIADLRLWADGEDPYALARGLAREWGLETGSVALDLEMPAHMVLGLQEALPGARFVIGEPALAALRSRKDADEIAAMRKAGSIADGALPSAWSALREGLSEAALQMELESAMRKAGGAPSFCVAAFGAGSAEPHHLSGDSTLEPGQIVLVDFGCDWRRYQSDITRTVCFGPATDRMREVYSVVYEAHGAARRAAGPGVPAQEVDRAARRVIERAGYGAWFFHRTGHGIGMQVHEPPYIVEGNAEPLRVGNCFSVEPGIYLAGEFGIRIENIVAITENGCESLNEEPSPDLLEIGA